MRDSKYEIIKIILLVIIVVCVGYMAYKPVPNGDPRPWQSPAGPLMQELHLKDGTVMPDLPKRPSMYQLTFELMCLNRHLALRMDEMVAKVDTLVQSQQR
jgi:hypothetical protein